jgi:hypothetical protein
MCCNNAKWKREIVPDHKVSSELKRSLTRGEKERRTMREYDSTISFEKK